MESPTPPDATPTPPRVRLAALPVVNAALRQMDVPLVSEIFIENTGATECGPVRLRVELDPPLAPRFEHVLQFLRPGETVRLDARDLELPLSLERLVNQVEAQRGTLRVTVETPEHQVVESQDLVVHAWNQWPGHFVHPESIACFVTPNHPALVPILRKAQETLLTRTGSAAIEGYQSGPERALAIAEALWDAARSVGIDYVDVPPSFGVPPSANDLARFGGGQKVLLPDQVLTDRMGNCLDLTVLLAALLERAGLHPVLVFIRGHAFPGVFVTEGAKMSAALSSDVTEVMKQVEAGRLLVFDSTALTHKVSLQEASAHATASLDAKTFTFAIDVDQCRRDRHRAILPLPARISADAPLFVVAESPGLPALPEVDLSPRGLATARTPEPQAAEPRSDTAIDRRIARWKGRLLDLSLRNPLLNFKLDGRRSLPIVTDDLAALENELATRETFALDLAEAAGLRDDLLFEKRTGVSRIAEEARTRLARRVLLVDVPPADALRRIVEMYRQARTLSEETGQSGAWLALGFLEWFETPSAKEPRYAPLILLPIEIQRGSVRDPFRVRLADDEPRINAALLKKVEAEQRLDVSGLDELPEDESGLDVALILERFRRFFEPLPRCRVVSRAAIGFFSFTKHMMWLDLEARTDALLKNPIVRHLLEDTPHAFPLARPFVHAVDLDHHRPAHGDLTVVEADSSQLVAVQGAIDGNSFVLEGPPGTGKSQTITNMIAEVVGRGESVLFVAEKRAAIEVVKDRLAKVGLGDFCLDLHAHDATKLEIIQALAHPLDLAKAAADAGTTSTHGASELDRRGAELDKVRGELEAIWSALHAPGACDVSVWQAISRLAELGPGETRIAFDFDGPAVGSTPLTEARWAAMRAAIHALAQTAATLDAEGPATPGRSPQGAPDRHAFAASSLADWNAKRESQIAKDVDLARAARDNVAQRLADLANDDLGLVHTTRPALSAAANYVATRLEIPPRAESFVRDAADPIARAQLLEAGRRLDAQATARAELGPRWQIEGLLATSNLGLAEHVRRWSTAFFLIAFVMLFGARRRLKKVARGPLPDRRSLAADLARAEALREDEAVLQRNATHAALVLGAASATDLPRDIVTARIAEVPRALVWCDTARLAIEALWEHAQDPARLGTHRIAPAAGRAFLDAQRQWEDAATTLERDLELGPIDGLADADLEVAGERLASWRNDLRSLRDWSAWVRHRGTAIDLGLEPFVAAVASGRERATSIEATFERSAMTWRVEDATAREPVLARFRGVDHEARVATFKDLDDLRQRLARTAVHERLVARLPDGRLEVGEVGVLRTELKKKRRHLPLRKLFAKIPTILPRLAPCVLMSPMSVAQYLDPALSLFDVVIFDEASQIPPWDAIGALGRGRRAIIVGDSKQMPPTSFFAKNEDDESDELETEEMESILDECDRSGLPKLSLKWHYRSRHPSLIQFSNHRYYDAALVTFPAAAAHVPGLGVRWMAVDGVYDKGGKRDNRKEAEVVVREVVRRLLDPKVASKSIGVVTFALPQRNLIEELLDTERRNHPEIEKYFDPKQVAEPVFVKNLENVQGDERDLIVFSMSYGPDKDGKVTLNFGALNKSGGERRLNVAVTRARECLLVVSSLRPDHIVDGRTSALGVRHLREFLAFAERNGKTTDAELAKAREQDPAGCIQALARHLEALGYRTEKNLGAPGPRIDLAVMDPDRPGEFVAGLVTDSPVWARFASIRDREKLGPAVLARQGWHLIRVMSLDWWHDPDAMLARVTAEVAKAVAAARAQDAAPSSPADTARSEADAKAPDAAPKVRAHAAAAPRVPAPRLAVAPVKPEPDVVPAKPEPVGPRVTRDTSQPMSWTATPEAPWQAVPYVRAPDVSLAAHQPEDDPRHPRWVAERVAEIVRIEGPIFAEDAVRRAYDAWEAARVTKKMSQVVMDALAGLPAGQRPRVDGDLLWPAELDPTSYTRYRVADDAARPAESIPLVEVKNAALAVLARALAMTEDELIGQLMQRFGIARRGKLVLEHLTRGIDLAIASAKARREGDRVRFV
ncbi:MAG: DUF4011 domain-containing protein [Deltaproteobacteria bacterium]|nr:DUF4011 domain-containing protein [Deltaproteobacteria bacterium]